MHYVIRITLIFIAFFATSLQAIDIDKNASIKDTKTSIKGINHIGLSVKNLDQALAFYQKATGFELVKREKVFANKHSDTLYGKQGVEYEVATLKAPNMLFELIAFNHNKNIRLVDKAAIGPGMTHTCFQSPSEESAYDKFVAAGARLLTPGNKPVDLGGYGVTYAYAYDPEGNMFEIEELDGPVLARAGYDEVWKQWDQKMWMTQVAFATPDIEKLMGFYEKVLGIKPYRVADIKNNTKIDEIVNNKNTEMLGGWFRMNDSSKMMEFWQFKSPLSTPFIGTRSVTDLGYTYSLEVDDIQAEYKRLLSLDVDFISEPQMVGGFWQVYARDIDGNIFSLREVPQGSENYSIKNFTLPG